MSAPKKTTAEAFEDLSDALAEARDAIAEHVIRGVVAVKEALATYALGFVPCSGDHGALSAYDAEPACPKCGAAL